MDLEKLLSFRGCKALTIVSRTKVKVKKAAPFKEVVKESITNGMTGGIYANAMSKAIGTAFTPGPRVWGTRIKGSPIVEHNGKKYLEMHVIRTKAKYFADGVEVPEEAVKPFMYAKKDSPVKWRDYSFESIKEVRMDGEVHGT